MLQMALSCSFLWLSSIPPHIRNTSSLSTSLSGGPCLNLSLYTLKCTSLVKQSTRGPLYYHLKKNNFCCFIKTGAESLLLGRVGTSVCLTLTLSFKTVCISGLGVRKITVRGSLQTYLWWAGSCPLPEMSHPGHPW